VSPTLVNASGCTPPVYTQSRAGWSGRPQKLGKESSLGWLLQGHRADQSISLRPSSSARGSRRPDRGTSLPLIVSSPAPEAIQRFVRFPFRTASPLASGFPSSGSRVISISGYERALAGAERFTVVLPSGPARNVPQLIRPPSSA
jgi:hypothetical protein